MLRYAEIGFFPLPFALFGVWWVLGTRATLKMLWAAAVVFALLAATTVWYGLERSLPAGTPYVPAEISHGTVVQGHGN